VNEDLCGLHGGFGWVVDGATGVSRHVRSRGPSDAAWLAGIINANLAGLAESEAPMRAVLHCVDTAVSQAFKELKATDTTKGDLAGKEDLGPSACLGLVTIVTDDRGIMLHGAFLGDVVALVPTPDGIIRWTDERAKPFERRTLATLALGEAESDALPERVRLQILENRRQLNRPNGYWAVQPERPWAGCEITFEAPITPSRPVVLATDGFMRLVDVFGAYTDDTLYAGLASGEAATLLEELREHERDAMAKARPRVKKHDDATVLVLDVNR
jgi:hypothetical protein